MPDPASTKAVIDILTVLSNGPLWLIILVLVLVPPLVLARAMYRMEMALGALRDEVRQENRDARERYENNVILVEDYVKLVKNFERMTSELVTQIRLSTEVTTELKTIIRERKGGM